MKPKCQVCGTVLDKSGVGVRICPTCKGGSHEECWSHLGGCIDPACRKSAKEISPASQTLGARRQSALLRRRLAWIMAQELRLSPDGHPDERKLGVGASFCVAGAVAAEVLEVEILVQLLGPGAILLAGLLLLHRGQRKRGQVHRWIPADSAPEKGVVVADWILFVEEGGASGRPSEQFAQDHLKDDSRRRLLDEACRQGVFKMRTLSGSRKITLGDRAAGFLEEARRRRAPQTLDEEEARGQAPSGD